MIERIDAVAVRHTEDSYFPMTIQNISIRHGRTVQGGMVLRKCSRRRITRQNVIEAHGDMFACIVSLPSAISYANVIFHSRHSS